MVDTKRKSSFTQCSSDSPEYVKTSLAGSISLGMEQGRFTGGAGCTCLNLLLNYETGCYANCGYCGLAANRSSPPRLNAEVPLRDQTSRPSGASAAGTFIRVRWPLYSLESILEKMKEARHPFQRVCVSMVTHPRAVDDCCAVINSVRSGTGLPVSALISPTIMNGKDDMRRIKEAGADRVGIAIDAATEKLFDALRGKGVSGPHKWERYFTALDEAVTVFGAYNAGVHLIVGIGETESEMARIIDQCHQKGAVTHLFSFYPEQGSPMEHHPRPSMGRYRRMQLARYLINESICSYQDFTFSSKGELAGFGIDIGPFIEKGFPFMTSGCPGRDGTVACNRPFGNERPSEPIRNYHFMPDSGDKQLIASQIFEDIE